MCKSIPSTRVQTHSVGIYRSLHITYQSYQFRLRQMIEWLDFFNSVKPFLFNLLESIHSKSNRYNPSSEQAFLEHVTAADSSLTSSNAPIFFRFHSSDAQNRTEHPEKDKHKRNHLTAKKKKTSSNRKPTRYQYFPAVWHNPSFHFHSRKNPDHLSICTYPG